MAGRVVLVTGAASGLGRATALACAAQGARLLLMDVDADALRVTAAEVAVTGGEAEVHVADVSDRASCFAAVEAAVERFGRLDALCNVAGILQFSHFCDIQPDDWSKVMAVNLTGAFYMCQAAIPRLIESHGDLVNVTSSGAIIGTAYTTAYGVSKAGLAHLTRCLAVEFADAPIRINAVAPGPMETNIGRGVARPDDLDPKLIERTRGLRPRGQPESTANLIAYLLSGASPTLHGAVISIDAGVTTG